MDAPMSLIPQLLEDCWDMGEIPYLEGPPGIGKSEAVHQLRDRKAKSSPAFFYREFRGATSEPMDLVGLPFPVEGKTTFLPPNWWPEHGPGILFLDEFPQSSPAMICAFSQVLDRVAVGSTFPADIRIILAGNRSSDGALARRLPSHIVDRVVKFQVSFDLEAWCNYNLAIGTDPRLVAFARFRPELFAAQPPKNGQAYLTGRSLTKCNKVLRHGIPDSRRALLFAGMVGDGAAVELVGFLKLCQNLISPKVVIQEPENAPIPAEISALLALISALTASADSQNFEKICKYALRLPPESSVLLISGILGKERMQKTQGRSITDHGGEAYARWVVEYQEALI